MNYSVDKAQQLWVEVAPSDMYVMFHTVKKTIHAIDSAKENRLRSMLLSADGE